MIQIISKSLGDTEQFAKKLAKEIPSGSVLALSGDLGSGKTTFLQYFLTNLGVARDEVLSPTFVIEHIYETKNFPIYHYDFYRLKSIGEVYELGIDEHLPPAKGIVVIEWANLFLQILPKEYYSLECRLVDENTREYSFKKVTQK